jgi:hypothetical protein
VKSTKQHSVWMFCAIMIMPRSIDFIISHKYRLDARGCKSIVRIKQKIIRGLFEIKFQMLENEDVIIKVSEAQNLSYVINIEEKSYLVQKISIIKSKIPVREPTTRGGVYFTDVEAYKVKVTTDLSIIPEIPKLMLGPNTDFKPIFIKTNLKIDGREYLITMTTHLTNAVNIKEIVELNLIVDKLDLK